MIKNYIFTVTAGRSGQATLHKILLQHAQSCLSGFEEPQIRTAFKGMLGHLEDSLLKHTSYWEEEKSLLPTIIRIMNI